MTDTFDRDWAGRPASEPVAEQEGDFAARLAAPLRTPEHLDDTFEARIMSAVHAEARARRRERAERRAGHAWWRRKRAIAPRPVVGAAVAAALVGALLVGDGVLRPPSRRSAVVRDAGGPAVAAGERSVDTLHLVRFVFVGGDASTVSVVGDFNGWSKSTTQLTRSPDGGTWSVTIPMPAGRHEYAFIVRDASGERWVADPLAATLRDEYGTESSVLHVGRRDEYGATRAS